MLNIMRADLYRIFKSKGIYITGIICLALLALQLFTNGTVGIGSGVVPGETAGKLPPTGANALFIAMADIDMLLYFLLPLIVFAASAAISTQLIL